MIDRLGEFSETVDSFQPRPSALTPSASNGKPPQPGDAPAAARQQHAGTIDMVQAASSNGVAAEVGGDVLLALQDVALATPNSRRTLLAGLNVEVRWRLDLCCITGLVSRCVHKASLSGGFAVPSIGALPARSLRFCKATALSFSQQGSHDIKYSRSMPKDAACTPDPDWHEAESAEPPVGVAGACRPAVADSRSQWGGQDILAACHRRVVVHGLWQNHQVTSLADPPSPPPTLWRAL